MATTTQAIQEIYIGLLGRAADAGGLAYWAAEIDGGTLTLEQLRANIVNEQPEYAAGLGSKTRSQVVAELYERLFERAAEADGLAYWVSGGGSTVNVDQLVLALSAGASSADRLTLDNKVEAASYYSANTLDANYTADAATAAVSSVDSTSASVAASKAATDEGSHFSGGSYVMTTGVDAITGTGGNDVISAVLDDSPSGTDTLQVFDNIDGKGGNDSLTVLVTDYDNDIVFPTMKSVENLTFNFTAAAATDSNTFDMSLVSGLKNLTVHFMAEADDSSDNEIHHLNAQLESLTYSGVDSGTDSSSMDLDINTWNATPIGIEELNIKDLFGSWTVDIDGLTNIPVLNLTNVGRQSDPDITLEVANSVATGTNDTLIINAANAGRMDYTDTNTVDVYLENAAGDEDLYEHVNLSLTGTNGFYLNDTLALSTVTLSGTGDTLLWYSDSDALTVLDGSGHSGDLSTTIDSVQDATVTLGDGDHYVDWGGSNGTGTVDATLTINTGAGSTWLYANGIAGEGHVIADLGAGNDYFDVSTANDYTIKLGDGNDILELNGTGDLIATDSVDGGSGIDTIIATAAEFADTVALSALSDFEQLIADGAGTYDMANLAGITNLIAGGQNEPDYGPRYWWDPAVTIQTRNETGSAADVTFTNVAAGTTLTLNKDNSQTVSYALATDTAADAVTVQLGNMDDVADSVVIGTATTDGLTLSGIETITINSITAAGATADTNTIQELVAAAATNLIITGSANTVINGMELTVDGTGTTAALIKIDASAATGNVTFGEASDSTNSIQYIGGSGIDTYLGTGNGDTINAGAGADAITLGAAGAADTIILEDGDSKIGGMDTYANFTTGEDSIDLGIFGFTGQKASAIFAKGAIAVPAADVTDFFSSAGVDRAVAWGTNGGNTYVYVDTNNDGNLNVATDLAVQLTGITSVALADFGF